MQDILSSTLSRSRWCGSLALAALLVACGGSDDNLAAGAAATTSSSSTGGGQVSAAEALFLEAVFPLLSQECGSCHASGAGNAPIYLTNDAASSYEEIKGQANLYQPPDSSLLLLHGAHTGPALSDQAAAEVTSWLGREFGVTPGGGSSASGGNTGSGLSVAEALDEFTKCMEQSRQEWEDSEMGLFPLIPTEDSGKCSGCHGAGNAGTWLNEDSTNTFENSSRAPYRNRYVKAEFNEGKFSRLVRNDRLVEKGGTACDPDAEIICHPKYFVPNQQVNSLNSFVASVLGKLQADGTCPF